MALVPGGPSALGSASEQNHLVFVTAEASVVSCFNMFGVSDRLRQLSPFTAAPTLVFGRTNLFLSSAAASD